MDEPPNPLDPNTPTGRVPPNGAGATEQSVHPTEANPLARPVDPAQTREEAGQSTIAIPLDADETIGIP